MNDNPEYEFWVMIIVLCSYAMCAIIFYWVTEFLEARRLKKIFGRKK
jgi:hypothetical protein